MRRRECFYILNQGSVYTCVENYKKIKHIWRQFSITQKDVSFLAKRLRFPPIEKLNIFEVK